MERSLHPVRVELLREVNDRIREIGDGFDHPRDGIEFICECGANGCVARASLHPEEYDRLRAHTGSRVLASGH